ncbi:hypothetical protein POM88_031756 [Heracleum sosnowskyi]|uniref:Uncharacterized protein n=1 Tax=Heracleum sosnowskyi TaxID=360622 RepID=A0AAD8HYU6_9APIA|nr:hypothetical protein POM88_031756 [Heracleum sosnowskyi]
MKTTNPEKTDRDSSNPMDDYDEELKCCVCLDLVYKPVVLSCGHMACFWCLYQTMGHVYTSYCPVCRSPFGNFPRICKTLHIAVLQLYPRVHKRRELQVREEEREYEMFSPHIWNIHSGEKLLTCNHVLCESCKKLLLQPVVLNCGHVHCEECLVGSSQFCKCSVCKSLHPNGFPKKCFALEHLIKLHLPKDYAERKLSSLGISIRHDSTAFQKRIELKTVPCASSTSICFPAWVIGHGPVVHYSSGCDQCGMLPLIGNRYHCRDCNGTSGFDLCEQCFRNFLNLPG